MAIGNCKRVSLPERQNVFNLLTDHIDTLRIAPKPEYQRKR